MVAPRLGPEPERDLERRGGRDRDADRREYRVTRREEGKGQHRRAEGEGERPHHGLDLAADGGTGSDRRGGDEVRRILAGYGEPAEGATELAADRRQHPDPDHHRA